MKYSDPDTQKPPEIEKAEIDQKMEALRRRAQQIARELDIRKRTQGMPSRLDLRPEAPASVHRLLSDFGQLVIFDGYSGYCHVPYEAVSDYIDRNRGSLPHNEAETRALFQELAAVRNRHVSEKHEAMTKGSRL